MKIAKTLTCCSFFLLLIVVSIVFNPAGYGVEVASAQSAIPTVKPCGWPLRQLPSQIGTAAFEQQLSDYVNNFCYRTDPGWKSDLEIRDTGAYLGGKYYGTHNAVRVYYSPEIVKWLGSGSDRDRKEGDIPDGGTIIKEMYPAPAQQNADRNIPCNAPFTKTSPANRCTGLAIMVKDKMGSYDGWFWSDGNPVNYTMYPNAGFGLYCVNCHASAKTELTFSTLNNIIGDSITFNPTMPPAQLDAPPSTLAAGRSLSGPRAQIAGPRRLTPEEDIAVHLKRSADGVDNLKPVAKTSGLPTAPAHRTSRAAAPSAMPTPKPMVSEWYDTATQRPKSQKPQMFITSNQCIGCHDATQNNPSMPNMVYAQLYNQTSPSPTPTPTELDLNLSPYSEWRSSMMGLAGRDPVFFSQLETEMNLYPGIKDQIVNTCLSCHGIMGQRQLSLDTGLADQFRLEFLDHVPPQSFAKYGALARDGISCAVCHHISDEGLGTPATYTGKFKTGPADEIYGPYQDVSTVPMKNSLGLTPVKTKANQIHKSALCGSCHTVILPVLTPGKPYTPGDNVFTNPNQKTGHEQNTYLEWRNSKYQDEFAPVNRETAQSCQQCHMPGKYPSKTGAQLKFKIASIEDETFPAVEFRAPDEEIHLRVRGGNAEGDYSRHTLVGLNLFVMEMFNQFSEPLGISSYNYGNQKVPFFDPMATYGNPVPSMLVTKKAALQMARHETAQVEVADIKRTPKGLSAQVKVTNLAGHKFPSGVSFRRAFIEFRVNVGGKPYWVSGATNDKGVIGVWKGGQFKPLITESFSKSTNPQQLFQPHYDVINSEEQVQIYEELVKDANGNFTTSFLSLANDIKDNRLMPQGWRENGPDAKDTAPHGVPRASNPNYWDGSGTDMLTYEVPLDAGITAPVTVSATIYYQTIPPYYLEQRYVNAPNGQFTNSLRYYATNLNTNYIDPKWTLFLNEAPIKDWKLLVVKSQPQTLR